jgi:hypothetical protein
VSFFKRLHLQKTRDRPHTPPDINRRAHKAESQLFVRTCHKMAKNRQRSEWPVIRTHSGWTYAKGILRVSQIR